MVALSRNVARKQAMEMLLTGDMIRAEEAMRIGLVNRVVKPDLLEPETMKLARLIADKPVQTVKIGKEAFYRQALALAQELGMRPLQAHCHRGLGTLSVQRGLLDLARTALATALDLYRAMDMPFWLPQTEAMLAQAEGQ